MKKKVLLVLSIASAQIMLAMKDPQEPLLEAITANNLVHVQELIKRGVDPNKPAHSGGTPLLLASQLGQFEIVQFLLTQNIDVNVQAKKFKFITPLCSAAQAGHHKIVYL